MFSLSHIRFSGPRATGKFGACQVAMGCYGALELIVFGHHRAFLSSLIQMVFGDKNLNRPSRSTLSSLVGRDRSTVHNSLKK